jgi:hypothetical protein
MPFSDEVAAAQAGHERRRRRVAVLDEQSTWFSSFVQ